MATNRGKKKVGQDVERQQIINFIEELCWLLDLNKSINLKTVSNILHDARDSSNESIKTQDKIISLIGILPSLLKDEEIFSNNRQLAQFAEEVLGILIKRWDKRSRNEIIGLIICEVEDVNKERLDIITQWSKDILNNKKKIQVMKNTAENNGNIFSWNETIQKLTGDTNE